MIKKGERRKNNNNKEKKGDKSSSVHISNAYHILKITQQKIK